MLTGTGRELFMTLEERTFIHASMSTSIGIFKSISIATGEAMSVDVFV
jgi:hypothetical protein